MKTLKIYTQMNATVTESNKNESFIRCMHTVYNLTYTGVRKCEDRGADVEGAFAM
jgi:hypothetical protein